ncbi:hypothetical protein LguiA_019420 [Lonicera macranthoides]
MKQFNHFSHRHPLHLTNHQTQNQNKQVCSCCEIDFSSSSQSYICTKPTCNFSLHIPCFNLPSQFTHKSHPKHPLSLQNDAVSFPCNACGDSPSGFGFHCLKCEFGLHVECASLPEVEEREDIHEHPLTLFYSVPLEFGEKGFDCGVCEEDLGVGCWVYGCLACNYGTHLECV